MLPELRHLRYLQAVAERGNFTRAAEDLHVSQPTLSQQIRQLERSLGAQLLDRSGRSVRLTDAGRAYLEHAARALRELAAGERAVHDVNDLSRGHLRLAVTPTFTAYLVGPLTAELRRRYPGITVTVRETSQERLESALLADELDLGIAFDTRHSHGITATTLFTETLRLVVGTGAPLALDPTRPVPARALEHHPLALLTPDFITRTHIDAHFAHHRITPRIALEANSIQALTEIVQRTPLATVLPDAITHNHPALTPLELDPPLPTRTAALLTRTGAYRTAATRACTQLTLDLAQAIYLPVG